MRMLVWLIVPGFMIGGSNNPSHMKTKTGITGNDLSVDVQYNTESLKKLLMVPHSVLSDPSAFLQQDEAYQYAMPFYTLSGQSFPEEQWKKSLKKYAEDPNKNNKYRLLVADLKRELSTFEQNVRPIWASFLPEREYTGIKGQVYFTAFVAFDAINIHDHIVINALHPKFHKSIDYLLNVLTHELFHSGYGSCSPYREEHLLQQKIYYLLETLHNEGLTTYVAMQACKHYPAPELREYKILKKDDPIKQLRQSLNTFFSEIDTMTTDEVMKKAWFLGVQLRGFYVVGADMARQIEMKKGRAALAETVAKGPVHFYELYHSLARAEDKLHTFDLLKYLSPADELQDAILSENTTTIDRVKSKILENKSSIPQSELEVFYRLGYRLLRGKKQFNHAETVFKLLLELADNPSFAYAYLGEIEIERGHTTQANDYLLQSLKWDPHNPLALNLRNAMH